MGDFGAFLFRVATAGTGDGFDAAVEGGWDGVPELEEGVFFKADVDEHGFDAGLDVAHLALVNGSDDVAVGVAFGGVFFEAVVLEEGDALFKALAADDKFDAGGFFTEAEKFFDSFDHGMMRVVLRMRRKGVLG